MAQLRERPRRWRTGVLLVLFVIGLGLLITRCPANRDGMSGQLAQAMDETTAAARSGALALDLRIAQRTTDQLTSVALSDARDEVVKAYKGIAELKADDAADIGRQHMLTGSMTGIVTQLNAAVATIRHVATRPSLEKARDQLRSSADALENGYR